MANDIILQKWPVEEMKPVIGVQVLGIYNAGGRKKTSQKFYRTTSVTLRRLNEVGHCEQCGREGTEWHLVQPKLSERPHLALVDKNGVGLICSKKDLQVRCHACIGWDVDFTLRFSLEEIQRRYDTDDNIFVVSGVSYKVSLGRSNFLCFINQSFCVACGKKATHWELRKTLGSSHVFLVLCDADGGRFTRDHIVPKSRYEAIFGDGLGRDSQDNSQTMCAECNCAKADTLPDHAPTIRIGRIFPYQMLLIEEHRQDALWRSCDECNGDLVPVGIGLAICTSCGQRHRRYLGTRWVAWSESDAVHWRENP